MTAEPAPLARPRRAEAAPGRVASVASAADGAGNSAEPRIFGLVASVASVASENDLTSTENPFARWWRGRKAPAPLPEVPQARPQAAPAAGTPLCHRATPQGCPGPSARAEQGAPAAVPAWLASLAAAICAALAEGAEREADPDGWLVLIRRDGRRFVVAPATVAELSAAGLLPDPLPPARETVEAARCARPPSWSDPDDLPTEGDRCGGCAGRRWWREAVPPLASWRCATCHPAVPGLAVVTVATPRPAPARHMAGRSERNSAGRCDTP